jgi:hypothetical protein
LHVGLEGAVLVIVGKICFIDGIMRGDIVFIVISLRLAENSLFGSLNRTEQRSLGWQKGGLMRRLYHIQSQARYINFEIN